MSSFNCKKTTFVIPQNDTPENRQSRSAELAQQQQNYRYDYPKNIGGLPMAATPFPVNISLVWAARTAATAFAIADNAINLVAPNVISFDKQISFMVPGAAAAKANPGTPAPLRAVENVAGFFESALRDVEIVAKDVSQVTEAAAMTAAVAATVTGIGLTASAIEAAAGLGSDVAAEVQRFAQYVQDAYTSFKALVNKYSAPWDGVAPSMGHSSILVTVADTIENDLVRWFEDFMRSMAVFLTRIAVSLGRATSLTDYAEQFSTLPLPWPAGVFETDEVFAQLRVAGPNPLMIRRATAADLNGFSVDDARYRSVIGDSSASVEASLKRNAFYVADYSALSELTPGNSKYVFTPKALFAVTSSGKRSLRPIAIQTAPGGQVFFPSDGTSWEISKVIVNMADANYHELVSHLGLTHLLMEPFVLATYRQLDSRHPLFALLNPHFAGTLLINFGAQKLLIAPGGAVDIIFTGAIQSSQALAANAVNAVRFNESLFPDTLKARGVEDDTALPDYPYRDDARSLWSAIFTWVSDYVQIYYPTDTDVTGDYELQSWIQELATLGHIQDIGEGPQTGQGAQIATAGYLAKLLTQVIFTASVQHATVNFPQSTIMAYTPVMPLAAYAPFPAAPAAPATTMLDILPPRQRALLQQIVGTLLGGVYYTVLGQYEGDLTLSQVKKPLLKFQAELRRIEAEINGKNALGARTPYTTLLPSVIPQSINI